MRCEFSFPKVVVDMLDEVAEEADTTRTDVVESILTYALADETIIDEIFGEAEEEEESEEEDESEDEEEEEG